MPNATRAGIRRLGDAIDYTNNAGSGTDGYPLTYDHDTGTYTLVDIVGAHVAGDDPHAQYLLADGSRDSTGLQTFVAGAALSAQPSADSHAITRGYVGSKLMNLFVNGSGLLSNNYNMSGFVFDAIETHGGGGSFKYTGTGTAKLSDEYIPVDPEKYYRLAVWAKAGDTGGGNYDAANKQYVGIVPYDADKLRISPYYYMRYSGSATTTLAAQLNPGDTTVTLTSASGWYNSTLVYNRQFLWWPYTNGLGYSYGDYTYSRNGTRNDAYYLANGAWASGGISGNTITLTRAWTGPTLPAGTPVANASDGSAYKYIVFSNISVPNAWTRYEGYIGGYDTIGANVANLFPYGTAYTLLLFLVNFAGSSSNIIRYSDIWFSELSSRNLESASATVPGVVALGAQQLGTGTKWVASKFGVGVSAEPTTYALEVAGQGQLLSTGANTSTVQNQLLVGYRSSGTPAAGLGVGILAQLKSSTTNDQDAGRLTWEWVTATHASRAARGKLSAYYTSTEQEAIRWDADSGGVKLGFFGATAVAKPSAYTLAGTATRTMPAPESAFTGQDNLQAGSVYAKSADIITLQTRVDSLEGVLRQLLVDLASTSGFGLLAAS